MPERKPESAPGPSPSREALVRALPKAELHVHVEGTLEPELAIELARRNGVTLRHPSVGSLRAAYDFRDLQSFLDLYYECAAVLRTERDFHDLTAAYLARAAAEGVKHVELFFDPQTHTARGVPFAAVVGGISAALREARDAGVGARLILCFLRHLSEAEAMATLTEALPYRDPIIAIGLDSSERGNPPSKFRAVFERARAEGLLAVAHAGEEGPASNVRDAIELLGVARVDHGVRCEEDDALVDELARRRMPLTVCPLSNVRLRVFPTMREHNLARLLRRGVCVSLHSDDPAYFRGYLNDNYLAAADALSLGHDEIVTLAKNGFEASFLPEAEKRSWMAAVDAAAAKLREA